MHESIAKAEIKGAFRRASERIDNFNNDVLNKTEFKISKKSCNDFNENVLKQYSDLLLFHKKTASRISWHFTSEVVGIDPDYLNEPGVGNLGKIVFEIYDTKKLKKGLQGFKYFETKFFLHEHFLIRLFQRTSIGSISDVGPYIMSFINWIVYEKRSLADIKGTLHVVLRNSVLICTCLPNNKGLVFKTILLNEMFTQKQTRFYQPALDRIENSDAKIVCYFEDDNKLSSIDVYAQKTVLNLVKTSPEWFENTINL